MTLQSNAYVSSSLCDVTYTLAAARLCCAPGSMDLDGASWQNSPVLEHAVIGSIVPDFPLINKSFNFSYSGQDL